MTNVEMMHSVANVNVCEYVENDSSVKKTSSPGSVIYEVVGNVDDCLKFFKEEERKYPSNPYCTKIIKFVELDKENVLVVIVRRSDTS